MGGGGLLYFIYMYIYVHIPIHVYMCINFKRCGKRQSLYVSGTNVACTTERSSIF